MPLMFLTKSVALEHSTDETTGNNDHCCRLESTYTCSEGCGTNILCNICEYTFGK
jgi:hypothetical protein